MTVQPCHNYSNRTREHVVPFGGRYIVVLVRTQRLIVQQEVPTTTARIPEIVLGYRIPERIARKEQARCRKALIVCRTDVRAYRHHNRPSIDRRRHREALGPCAPKRAPGLVDFD